MIRFVFPAFLALFSFACGSAPTTETMATDNTDTTAVAGGEETPTPAPTREPESPPASGPARDIQFPPIARTEARSGLEVNVVSADQLPLVYLRLVIRSGASSDPSDLPGLAQSVADMLKEGTRNQTSAELAERVEFLGADLSVGADEDNVYVMVRALSDQLDEAMDILAEVAMQPRFAAEDFESFKRRELNRLALVSNRPRWLARRTLYRELYGEHPYAHVDTTPEAIERMRRVDLIRWHRMNFAPSNAFLVAVGNVSSSQVNEAANRAFRGWRDRDVREVTFPEPPTRESREVIVVDRPQSVQSVIYVGNLALARNNASFVPLQVANQVLGGSAASRLFMDLREQRSLTYGAYSRVGERQHIAPFLAYAAVRNEVTEEAMSGFFEHLDRIVAEPCTSEELENAQRYLSDSFPLQIETAGRIASMVEELRIFGLQDNYWEGYRSSIRNVTNAQAFDAAQQFIRPSQAVVVAVGRAAAIVEPLRRYGAVRVIDTSGNEISTFDALPQNEESPD